jgi:hypothetical protein
MTLTRQTISLYFDKDQQTNLATHKPTQEKIKTPHRTKKLNLPTHILHIWFCPTHKPNPSQKPKEQNFPTA